MHHKKFQFHTHEAKLEAELFVHSETERHIPWLALAEYCNNEIQNAMRAIIEAPHDKKKAKYVQGQ